MRIMANYVHAVIFVIFIMLFIFLLQAGASNVIGAHLFQASGANPTLYTTEKARYYQTYPYCNQSNQSLKSRLFTVQYPPQYPTISLFSASRHLTSPPAAARIRRILIVCFFSFILPAYGYVPR